MSDVIFFLLVFFNFLNPISPILTIIIDILIFAFVKKKHIVHSKSLFLIVGFGLVIWLWSLFVMAVNLHFDAYIFFKYFRMPIMALLLSICVFSLELKKGSVINSVYYLGILNLLAIIIELLFPSTREIISTIFKTTREDIVSIFNFRVMGLTGAFENCAILCILLMVACYYKYKKKRSLFHLFILFMAFGSLVFVSRTGMLVGFVVLLFLLFGLLKASKSYHKIIIGTFSFVMVFLAISIALPILVNSSGLFDETMDTRYDIEFGSDYGSGTASHLTKGGSHTNILNEPLEELFFGYGINSEDVTTKQISTDIGYLEFICHIGIVGLILIIVLHLLLIKNLLIQNKKLKLTPGTEEIRTIYNIAIIYTIVLFIFNYKLMLLYSRGTFELMVILMFSGENLANNKIIWKESMI